MSDKFRGVYIILALMLISTLVYFQIAPLRLESSHLVMAAETGIETAEERAHEENTNVQNGFSPAGEHANVTQAVNISSQSNNLSLSSLMTKGSPVFGNKSAPVTIVEFGDFQCQFCGRFAKQTEPSLNTTYFQTGKVNLVFKHFVTHGSDSLSAAIASQCANDQGKFWNFYKVLYNNQGEENSGWANLENLKKFAAGIPGMNTQEFNSCLDSQKYKPFVENDIKFAIASGFQGTPTFIIEKGDGSDREMLLGAYPFPSFQAIIEKKLSGG
ncbi:MAG: thioredoxin domain-containing protein [Nitrososphaerota archaeon]